MAHPHHHHHPGRSHPPARVHASLMRLGVVQRLATAIVIAAGLWALVLWSIQGAP